VNVAKRNLSNTSGTYRSTLRNIMAAFNKLPREVRELSIAQTSRSLSTSANDATTGASVGDVAQA
jgi:hypothetical protein